MCARWPFLTPEALGRMDPAEREHYVQALDYLEWRELQIRKAQT